MNVKTQPVPVIDLFAGPGGLGEGFASYGRSSKGQAFEIKLSIEKDAFAHQTLQLRSFFRQFPHGRAPAAYYDFLRQADKPTTEALVQLYAKFPLETERAAWKAWRVELGKEGPNTIRHRIVKALDGAKPWVLLGGPPCQAYSIAGRSRNKGNADYEAEEDDRQYLYLEFLQVIAEHGPPIFVMENVKGLLSATLNNRRIFDQIVEDLHAPVAALQRAGRPVKHGKPSSGNPRYHTFSLTERSLFNDSGLHDFVVRMEKYGIPQARHRLILLGVREDLGPVKPGKLSLQDPIKVSRILCGLPRIRSGLSGEQDSPNTWISRICSAANSKWFLSLKDNGYEMVYGQLKSVLANLALPRADRGARFVKCDPDIDYQREWFLDDRMEGVCNHDTRSHILEDLYRYLYASCFAKVNDRSPCLKDFPADLLPKHKNVENALEGGMFEDRFRVQLSSRPATTITSHIAKDGHYYIHPDPSQCRSLTVREAARLQTFPDNYFFCGPRTSQYTQVGNAVPPLLAHGIAKIVYDLLNRTGIVD
jgi:DNA (cytosine-5)-methyltransferase 1